MLVLLGWVKDFFQMVFGNFWASLTTVLMKLLLGPVAFFLFGPLFKISGRIAVYLLDQIKPVLGDVGLTADGLMAWFIDVLRLQECVSSLITFLILGLMISIIKKVFG